MLAVILKMARALHCRSSDEESSMKDFKYLLIILSASVALAMTACAKKDSEFAARYARNKMGANVADGKKTQEAGEQAAAQGLDADVVDIQKHFAAPGQPGPNIVTALILINNQQMPVTTSHTGTEIVNGSVNTNGFTIVYHAMCGTVDCNPYYVSMEIYRNNQMVIQEGLRKYFEKTSADQTDVYQWFKPEEALPLLGSDSADIKGMVGFLNNAAASGGSSSSTIIK